MATSAQSQRRAEPPAAALTPETRLFFNRELSWSADWMPRNFVRRIEVLCPIEDPLLRARLQELLGVLLDDNVKARRLQPDGSYQLPAAGLPRLRAQQALLEAAGATRAPLVTVTPRH